MVHTISRIQVLHGKDTICITQIAAPNNGTNGTNGVLKGLFKSGCFLRRTKTDKHKAVNASKVPIDTNSLSTCRGKSPANIIVIIQANMVARCGMPCLLCTFEKNFGINPSFDIA